jgi:SHS2 domain-containing protein
MRLSLEEFIGRFAQGLANVSTLVAEAEEHMRTLEEIDEAENLLVNSLELATPESLEYAQSFLGKLHEGLRLASSENE